MTLNDIKTYIAGNRERIISGAAALGRDPKIYLHWTAGTYDGCYPEYHFCITGNGDITLTHDFNSEVVATWRRNTGSIAVALCCAYNADENHLGSCPPTNEQIEALAQFIAAACGALDIPIDKTHVLTHGEAAANEDGIVPHPAYAWWNDECGDGDTRGDLEYLGTPESPRYNPWATDGARGGDVLRGKAIWYQQQGV